PCRPAADAHRPDLRPGREDRLGDVADRKGRGLEDRPREVAPTVSEGEPDERAARGRVPERRALAGEIRQEDDAVRAGRNRASLLDQGRGGRGALEDLDPEP